jgi:tetratricopeptide (TPR) repeat protein
VSTAGVQLPLIPLALFIERPKGKPLMHKIHFLFLGLLIAILSGCAVTDIAQEQFVSLKNFTVGEYYIDNQKYREGIANFKKEVAENPNDPKAFYYLGRCYLAENMIEDALKALKKAVQLDPGHADSRFWLGVAYAAAGDLKAERQNYEIALRIDPDHVPALVYMGHNRFEAKDYRKALTYYERALALAPNQPQALFNRGLIYRHYDRTPEEIQAWRIYLENYPQGANSRQAAEFLNGHGIFDYRNHLIGIRTITLGKIHFEPFTATIAKSSQKTLDYLGGVFAKQTPFELHILAYQKNNKDLAKARAKSIKRYLSESNRRIGAHRIKISWFDAPEKISVGKTRYAEDEAIDFFTRKRKS